MAIHGVVSTYFGDLEYDLGKSLGWTQNFCDSVYVYDVNTSDGSRQYIIDWDRQIPKGKYSFSPTSFFGSPARAAAWRKQSFEKADAAWSYNENDWVLFVDGTEGLNVFHDVPVSVVIESAAVEIDGPSTLITFTLDGPHDIAVGNRLRVQGATVVDDPDIWFFDSVYLVVDTGPTSVTVLSDQSHAALADTALTSIGGAFYTTEPVGYHEGNLFQSWLSAERSLALEAGKDLISLPGWALVRSGSPEALSLRVPNQERAIRDGQPVIPGAYFVGEDLVIDTQRCEKYYLNMGPLVRFARVGALRDPEFDWGLLDLPNESLTESYYTDRLALISYAYVRWSENPVNMTQSVEPTASNYVDPNAGGIPLRPVTVDTDTGFAMRRLISTVRKIEGFPTEWEDEDGLGEQPMVGDQPLLDMVMVEAFRYDTTTSTLVLKGFGSFGGSPLYPGILRRNLREGVWYTSVVGKAVVVPFSTVAYDDETRLVTVVTAKPHYLAPGQRVTVAGTNPSLIGLDGYGMFDGEAVLVATPTATSFTYRRETDFGLISPTTTPMGYAITMPDSRGPIPWNYLLHEFGVTDPAEWIRAGSRFQQTRIS